MGFVLEFTYGKLSFDLILVVFFFCLISYLYNELHV